MNSLVLASFYSTADYENTLVFEAPCYKPDGLFNVEAS
jgi:hypothetical protein